LDEGIGRKCKGHPTKRWTAPSPKAHALRETQTEKNQHAAGFF
jgi:hypothetical protein